MSNNYNNECLNAPDVDSVKTNMGYSRYITIYIFDRMQEVTIYECFNLFVCIKGIQIIRQNVYWYNRYLGNIFNVKENTVYNYINFSNVM